MTDSLTLRILDRFSWIFRFFKVDYQVLRLVVGFKLMMDQRRVPTIMSGNQQKKDSHLTPFVKSLLMYALLGLLMIPFLVLSEGFYFMLTIAFALVMFILTTSMISDFSSVLLDVRDKVVLDTKPIDKRTLSFAKFVHVVVYMTQLAGALLLIPFVVSSLFNGWLFSVVLLVSLLLISIFSIVVTALFYMLILKFFDGEKLRNLINYVQIGLSIMMVFIYQLIGRSFTLIDLSMSFSVEWWHLLLPPFWFSALFEVVLNGADQPLMLLSASLAIFVPLLSLWVYFKSMPAFEQNLAKLMNEPTTKKVKKTSLLNWIGKKITRDQQEHAVFGFARIMLSQEREFKLKVYPSLGISIALPLFLMAMNLIDGFGVNQEIDYLFGYFSLLTIPTTAYMLKYSAKSKGAFVYKVLPVKEEAIYYRATLKAFIVQLFLPIIVLLTLIYLYFIGPIVLLHFSIIFLIGCILTPIIYRVINNGRFPFNESFSFVESANAAIIFIMMFIVGILAVIHYLASTFPLALYIYLPILIVINQITWRKIFPPK